jgi:hypothetical protein
MSTATLEHPTMTFPPEFNIEQPDQDLAATTVNLKLRSLAEIETSLSGMVENRPGRKYRFAVE